MPQALGQPSRHVDQLRPRRHQPRARSDHRQVQLRLHTPVLDRVQDSRIHPSVQRQLERVLRVALVPASRDPGDLSRIRHDHLMPHCLQLGSHPVGLAPCLNHDPMFLFPGKVFLQPRLRGRQFPALHLLAGCILGAVTAVAVPQIDPDRQAVRRHVVSRVRFICFGFAILLHGWSPFCTLSACSTGSLRYPAGDQPSHPICPTIEACPSDPPAAPSSNR